MTEQIMVSVPRELLDYAASELERHNTPGAANRAHDLRSLLAAPAENVQCSQPLRIQVEDVRAVVDEPVHQVRSHGSCCWEDVSGESLESCRCQPEHYEIRKLYSNPQRPVVMPEREFYTQYMLGIVPINAEQANAYKDGWNACLDEFKRLNP